MNSGKWTPQERFDAIGAFLNKGWRLRLGQITLDELKTGIILAVTESPGRACHSGNIPARILTMLQVTVDDDERARFAAKVEPVVKILITRNVLARYRMRPSTLKLVGGSDRVLEGLLRRLARNDRPAGGKQAARGAVRVEPGLVELDDPLLIKGRSVAHVSVPLDTSYHVKLPVELLFSDRTFCMVLFDRETPKQRKAMRELLTRMRTAGGTRGDWDEFEYQLRLRGIEME